MKDIFFDLPEWHDQPRLVREIPGLGRPAGSLSPTPKPGPEAVSHDIIGRNWASRPAKTFFGSSGS